MCFLFTLVRELACNVALLAFCPLSHLFTQRSPTGYCGNRAACSRLFFAVAFFEVDITHSFIKHLRIWQVLEFKNGIKRFEKLGPGLENVCEGSLGIIRNRGIVDPKGPVLSLKTEVIEKWKVQKKRKRD